MADYNKDYAKTVKPRFKADYKGQAQVITKDKGQANLLNKRHKVKIDKQGQEYIITFERDYNG